MKMYRARTWFSPQVNEYEVVKKSDKTVTFIDNGVERRENLSTQDFRWFDDFDSAKRHVVNFYSRKLDRAQEDMKKAINI